MVYRPVEHAGVQRPEPHAEDKRDIITYLVDYASATRPAASTSATSARWPRACSCGSSGWAPWSASRSGSPPNPTDPGTPNHSRKETNWQSSTTAQRRAGLSRRPRRGLSAPVSPLSRPTPSRTLASRRSAPRVTDLDPKKDRQAERQVIWLFWVSILGSASRSSPTSPSPSNPATSAPCASTTCCSASASPWRFPIRLCHVLVPSQLMNGRSLDLCSVPTCHPRAVDLVRARPTLRLHALQLTARS